MGNVVMFTSEAKGGANPKRKKTGKSHAQKIQEANDKIELANKKAELKQIEAKNKEKIKKAKDKRKLEKKKQKYSFEFTDAQGRTTKGTVYNKRGLKKAMNAALEQSVFSSKPASVRNVEQITNSIMGLEAMRDTLRSEGYDKEADQIDALFNGYGSLLDKAGKDPKVAEILAGTLNKGKSSDGDSVSGSVVEI